MNNNNLIRGAGRSHEDVSAYNRVTNILSLMRGDNDDMSVVCVLNELSEFVSDRESLWLISDEFISTLLDYMRFKVPFDIIEGYFEVLKQVSSSNALKINWNLFSSDIMGFLEVYIHKERKIAEQIIYIVTYIFDTLTSDVQSAICSFLVPKLMNSDNLYMSDPCISLVYCASRYCKEMGSDLVSLIISFIVQHFRNKDDYGILKVSFSAYFLISNYPDIQEQFFCFDVIDRLYVLVTSNSDDSILGSINLIIAALWHFKNSFFEHFDPKIMIIIADHTHHRKAKIQRDSLNFVLNCLHFFPNMCEILYNAGFHQVLSNHILDSKYSVQKEAILCFLNIITICDIEKKLDLINMPCFPNIISITHSFKPQVQFKILKQILQAIVYTEFNSKFEEFIGLFQNKDIIDDIEELSSSDDHKISSLALQILRFVNV